MLSRTEVARLFFGRSKNRQSCEPLASGWHRTTNFRRRPFAGSPFWQVVPRPNDRKLPLCKLTGPVAPPIICLLPLFYLISELAWAALAQMPLPPQAAGSCIWMIMYTPFFSISKPRISHTYGLRTPSSLPVFRKSSAPAATCSLYQMDCPISIPPSLLPRACPASYLNSLQFQSPSQSPVCPLTLTNRVTKHVTQTGSGLEPSFLTHASSPHVPVVLTSSRGTWACSRSRTWWPGGPRPVSPVPPVPVPPPALPVAPAAGTCPSASRASRWAGP